MRDKGKVIWTVLFLSFFLLMNGISVVHAISENNFEEDTAVTDNEELNNNTVVQSEYLFESAETPAIDEISDEEALVVENGENTDMEEDVEDEIIALIASFEEHLIEIDTSVVASELVDADSLSVPEGGKVILSGINEYQLFDSTPAIIESGTLSTTAVIGNTATSYTIEITANAEITVSSIEAMRLSIKGNSNSTLTVNGKAYGIRASLLDIDNIQLNVSTQGYVISATCSMSAVADLGYLTLTNSTVTASGTTVLNAERGIVLKNSSVIATLITNTDGGTYGHNVAAYVSELTGNGSMKIIDSSFTAYNNTTGTQLTQAIWLRGNLETSNSEIKLGENEKPFHNGIYLQGYSLTIQQSIVDIYAKQVGVMAKEAQISNQSQVMIISSAHGMQLDTSGAKANVKDSNLNIAATKYGIYLRDTSESAGTILLLENSDITVTSQDEFAITVANGTMEVTKSTLSANTSSVENKAAIIIQQGDLILDAATVTVHNPLVALALAKGIYVITGTISLTDSKVDVSTSNISIAAKVLDMNNSTIDTTGGIVGLYIIQDGTISSDSKVNAEVNEFGGDGKLAAVFGENTLTVNGTVTAVSPFEGIGGVVVLDNIQLGGKIDATTPYHSTSNNDSYSAVFANWYIVDPNALVIENYTKAITLDSNGKDMDTDNPTMDDFQNYHWEITSGSGQVAVDIDKNVLYVVQGNADYSVLSAQSKNHEVNYLQAMLNGESYTVRFELNYSNPAPTIPDQLVNVGAYIIRPAVPARQNFRFLGWYDEDGNEWYFDDDTNPTPMPNNELTLWAHWEATDNTSQGNHITPIIPANSIIVTGVNNQRQLVFYPLLLIVGLLLLSFAYRLRNSGK